MLEVLCTKNDKKKNADLVNVIKSGLKKINRRHEKEKKKKKL